MRFLKNIITTSVLALLFTSLYAQQDDLGTLIKKSGEAKDYPKSQVLTIFDSSIVDVEESGLSHFRTHTLQKVLTDKGITNLSVIKFTYDPFSAYMIIEKVRIHRKNGSVEEVLSSRIYDYPQPANLILWGAREIMVAPGRLDIGDAIEIVTYKKGFSYALLLDNPDEKYIPPMRGHFYDIVPFWSSEDVLSKVYQLTLPKSKELQYEFFDGGIAVKVKAENDKRTFTFSSNHITHFPQEQGMVSLWDVAPKLIMTTSPDWEAKSRWFYGVNEDFGSFDGTPDLKKQVDEILKGAANEHDSVARLNHWVADNIRYMGLNMGPGEGFTLHKAEMTYTDKCGVCKDKAGILVAMLRAAGFESYAAMTMAGSKIENIPADHFNHSVTAVKLSDGKFHMLDPTWVPFVREMWSSREQQQNYIIGTKKGEKLEEIPLSDPENHYLKITGKSRILEDGSLEGELTLTAEGQSDALIRSPLTRNYRHLWDEMIEKELLETFPSLKIWQITYSDAYDYTDPFKLYIKYVIKDFTLMTKDQVFFVPPLANLIFKSLTPYLRISSDVIDRKYNFKDFCTQMIELEETISLPEGWDKSNIYLPEKRSSDGSGASFYGAYSLDQNQLHFKQKTVLKKRVYTPDDWASFRQAILNRNYFASERVILSR